jgi:SagB-type dehydrogenase family enzyme
MPDDTASIDAEIRLHSSVFGGDEPELDDLAEAFHEASKLYPALAERQLRGMQRLATSDALLIASRRSVRRNTQRATIPLPHCDLAPALRTRRSAHEFTRRPLALQSLATLLEVGYGVTVAGRRTVPSGGALYPLELYAVAVHVDGLDAAIFHFDPPRHVLELVRHSDVAAELETTGPLPGLLADAAAVIFVTAVFWRSRFKYGLRGYRFALLEAGHVMQNMLIAATELGVQALPLGGFYDTRAERLLGIDGVDESAVYAVGLGGDP